MSDDVKRLGPSASLVVTCCTNPPAVLFYKAGAADAPQTLSIRVSVSQSRYRWGVQRRS